MINSVVGGLVYVKVRRVMELFPPRLRTLWKDWELHAMVLLSLTLQMILILFGNRRKYKNRIWIRIVLWCSYLMADWVATVALGVILDNVSEGSGKDGPRDSDVQLTAFWAPFLLLHLGGPDTITAYSLEDNELWLRHLLGLGVETGVALFILLMAWTDSRLSILSILMFCAGIIKYGERTWALRSASNEEFRASMLTPADPGPNYAKFMQEYSLKEFEGFQVIAEEINEVHVNLSSVQNNNELDLLTAYNLLQIFKRLFVDLILGVDDRESSQSLFAGIGREKAFKLIEIELGFVYDMLYTKAPVVHSLKACILRLISFACTCSVLVFFSLADHKHSSVDLLITYLLLGAAVVLEVYAVLLLFSSDWTDLWLYKQRKPSSDILKPITCLQLPKPPRWSNSMGQFNALSFYLNDKTTICDGIQKLLCLNKVLEKYQYTKYREVSGDLKQLIFDHLKSISEQLKSNGAAVEIRPIISCRGSQVLNHKDHTELDWSVKVDFDQSILIWHIATYLCYKADPSPDHSPENEYHKLSKRLSQYMIYLLVMHPYMLPVGIGMIRFRDTQAEVIRFFEEYNSASDNTQSQTYNVFLWAMEYLSTGKSREDNKLNACKMLLKVKTAVEPVKVKGDRSKSVLFEGCRLASQLRQGLQDGQALPKEKWEMISNVWVEMLAYAASQCRGSYHAQQLRRGGELLSHVWLLMAHFGLTDQFQISQGHARVKLVVK